MPLIIIAIGILLLIILISLFKLNAFLSLLIASFFVGLLGNMEPVKILVSITKGIGDTMGNLALIIAFGAMLGKIIEDSGAAYKITHGLIELTGIKRIQIAMVITGFVVGLPMIYNAGFLVLIPLVYALWSTTKLPMIYLGLPLCAALSVTHGFLPPHPAPTAVAFIYHANVNKTLLYGIIVAIPAILVGGPFLSQFYKNMKNEPPKELFIAKDFSKENLPSFTVSLLTALSPVILILTGALSGIFLTQQNKLFQLIKFISDPVVALFFAVFISIYFLGIRQNKKMSELMKSLSTSVSGVAMILLIIASGGAFKQVLIDAGTGEYIKDITLGFHFSPLIMAWSIAALLRLATGSATVSCITAAGISLPLINGTNVSPELMVLATGAGSLMFSHFNDVGFWMFKEYYNISIKQTFAVWTVMETVIGLVGLIGVMIMSLMV
jgi:Gnt-I system high-affinity gluconate transporter